MGLIRYENWDSYTAPAIPPGWNAGAGLATTSAGETPVSAPNMLNLGANAGTVPCTWGTADSNGGDVSVTGYLLTTSGHGFGSVFARCNSNSLAYGSSTFYEFQWDWNTGAANLNAVVAGSPTAVGSASGVTIADNAWYLLTMDLQGATQACYVQDPSTGYFLSPAGSFGPTIQACIVAADSSVSGAGYAGLILNTAGVSQQAYADDWSFSTFGVTLPSQGAVLPYRRRPITGTLFSQIYG